MEKTALTQLRDLVAANDLTTEELLQEIEVLIQLEQQQIIAAWIRGNAEGWAMSTDWPSDAYKYYRNCYVKEIPEAESAAAVGCRTCRHWRDKSWDGDFGWGICDHPQMVASTISDRLLEVAGVTDRDTVIFIQNAAIRYRDDFFCSLFQDVG